MNPSDLFEPSTAVVLLLFVLAGVAGFLGWRLLAYHRDHAERLADDLRTEAARRAAAEADRERLAAEAAKLTADLTHAQARRQEATTATHANYNAWKHQKAARTHFEDQAKALQADLARSRRRAGRLRRLAKGLAAQVAAVARQDGRVWHAPVAADAPPFVPLAERKTPVVAVLNLKGGVGKTTITANLGAYFGEAEKRVLMLDLDHQRSLSQMLLTAADRERGYDAGRTVQHVLQADPADGTTLIACADAVPGADHCWLVPNADPDGSRPDAVGLDDLEMRLMSRWLVGGQGVDDVRLRLRAASHAAAVRQRFDMILFDCPPRLSTACVNAVAAADLILVPVQPEAVALQSVLHLLKRLRGLRASGLLPGLKGVAVVANMVPPAAAREGSPERRMLAAFEQKAKAVWGEPVPTLKSLLTRMPQYASATKVMHGANKLKLAVHYPAIKKQFVPLAGEIEGLVYERVGAAGVPA